MLRYVGNAGTTQPFRAIPCAHLFLAPVRKVYNDIDDDNAQQRQYNIQQNCIVLILLCLFNRIIIGNSVFWFVCDSVPGVLALERDVVGNEPLQER